ncbi:MAG: hypothetical protein A3F41_06455 [Coxiella sp. RIFCSPHIGHO2_12_FULL_44_14]|nr:MAG: hypothetical protein A3F41_06455 [Coxiella sp. RIFCSPHIGHO2_12_FULL_44_14]
MKAMVINFILMISALGLTACSTTNSQWTGGFFGGYVNFSVTSLGPNKYMLEADASAAVKREALIKAYEARAKKLCLPKPYTLKYSIEPYKYSSSVLYSYVALKITGLVLCQ